ncbi:DNA-directed DNA polymerase domain protein [Acinetobacter baumannii 1297]|nr:DNA-directed DNA polymerase domain protein [Acinetobacter baumannii 1297]
MFNAGYRWYSHQIWKEKVGVGPCFVPGRNWSMSRDKLSRNPFKLDELLVIKS